MSRDRSQDYEVSFEVHYHIKVDEAQGDPPRHRWVLSEAIYPSEEKWPYGKNEEPELHPVADGEADSIDEAVVEARSHIL